MPPKRPKKKAEDRFRCDDLEGEKFHATGGDDVFRFNWWEVFCFPYILCARFWDCFVSLCAGTNQCLVYWMIIQWIICKLSRLCSPDNIVFPYYFYMFGQVIILTLFFILLWVWFGESFLIPYFVAFYEAFSSVEEMPYNKTGRQMRFRKYCFRKGEIFDNPNEKGSGFLYVRPNNPLAFVTLLINVCVNKVF